MDGGDKIVVCVVVSILLGVVSIVSGITASSIYDTRAIVRLVEAGADPIGARCGIAGISQSPMCSAYVAKH